MKTIIDLLGGILWFRTEPTLFTTSGKLISSNRESPVLVILIFNRIERQLRHVRSTPNEARVVLSSHHPGYFTVWGDRAVDNSSMDGEIDRYSTARKRWPSIAHSVLTQMEKSDNPWNSTTKSFLAMCVFLLRARL